MHESAPPPPASTSEEARLPVVELRQYTLRPGRRAALIDLFDSRFVEAQEETGMTVIGQFRDLDDPDRFVWLRGFPSMADRASSLRDFYDGPIWQSHRAAANSTMVDSGNVLLLRPARHDSGFRAGERQPWDADGDVDRGVVDATVLSLEGPADSDTIAFFEWEIAPAVTRAGFSILAYLLTEAAPNTFPRLPVREGENVFVGFVGFAGFADGVAYTRTMRDPLEIIDAMARTTGLLPPPRRLRLEPTSRSALTGSTRACPAASHRLTTT